MELVFSLIKPEAIMAMPSPYNWAAIAILGYAFLRVIFSILKFRLIKATTSLFFAVFLAIIISAFAPVVSVFDGGKTPVENTDKDAN